MEGDSEVPSSAREQGYVKSSAIIGKAFILLEKGRVGTLAFMLPNAYA